MLDILIQAGSYVAVIVLGYIMRAKGVFKNEDFRVLSTIVVKITLPAVVVSNFRGKEIDTSMLLLTILGLLCGLIYIGVAYFLNVKAGKEQQAFEMVNTSGYNIGNFTLPFVQSFLGPMGIITASLFDTGNACVCLGGSYSIASMVKDGNGFSLKIVAKKLSKSLAVICCFVMIFINLTHFPVPEIVYSFADIIAAANPFIAMLMVGVGFKMNGDKKQIGTILRILAVRYSIAIGFAILFYLFLPFSMEIKRTLMILAFAPIAGAAPAFTAEMDSDIGLSSAINSISIVISIVLIIMMLLITA